MMNSPHPIGPRRGRFAVVAAMTLIALSCPPEALARAGGGHNHGGGVLTLILLPFLLLYAWHINGRINDKKKRTEQAMAGMAARDPVWNEPKLEAFVRADFFRIERAWSQKDFRTLGARLEAKLFENWRQQLETMTAAGHTNILEDLSLAQIRFVEAMDFTDKNRDLFTVCLDASAMDYTVNEFGTIVESNAGSRRARLFLRKENCSFREFWTYNRRGEEWMLATVDQAADWRKSVDMPIVRAG